MKGPYKSFCSGCRLAVGGAWLPYALLRGRDVSNWDLITVDVFATLLTRTGDDDAAWREGAVHAVEVARLRGVSRQHDPLALRRAVERRLSHTLSMKGQDPEFTHQHALEQMLREVGAGDWASAEAKDLAAWELEREIIHTRSAMTMATCVKRWADAGKRVVAVSDTRYDARELALMFSRHGIVGISAIYASADHGASKFSGKLFDLVAKLESADPQKILHIGDSMTADWLAAAQRGLAIRPVQILSRQRS